MTVSALRSREAGAASSGTGGRRARLTDAAARVVGERGLWATTVGDIVGLAHVSRAAFYEHFEDRDDCFLAAAEELIDTIAFAQRRACSGHGREGMERALDVLLDLCAAEPALTRAYLVETQVAGRRGAILWDAHIRQLAAQLRLALARIGIGVHEETAIGAIGGVHSIARNRLVAGRASELPALAPDLRTALWSIVSPAVDRNVYDPARPIQYIRYASRQRPNPPPRPDPTRDSGAHQRA